MFSTKHIEAGEIKVKELLEVRFPYDNGTVLVDKIVAECDCTQFYNDSLKREIVVQYKSDGIPLHLVAEGLDRYTVTKTITVDTRERGLEGLSIPTKLTFTVTIVS